MRSFTPNIAWSADVEAIYSVDFQFAENSASYRIASGGLDPEVKIWGVTLPVLHKSEEGDDEKCTPEFLSNLTGHSRTVNVVRFSPNGVYLASADVEGTILLWVLSSTSAPDIFSAPTTDENADVPINREIWNISKRLRNHLEDVNDVAWSSDSQRLVSASVDKSIIVWDVAKGACLKLIKNPHKHFVVGACFDPRGKYVVSVSQDRTFNVYNAVKLVRVFSVGKAELPNPFGGSNERKQFRLFHDDSGYGAFARRPDFSPDGEFLFMPAGSLESNSDAVSGCVATNLNATYIFSRTRLDKPCAVLLCPPLSKPTIAVRVCPRLFKLLDDADDGDSDDGLPKRTPSPPFLYRIVFAVLTLDKLLIYDSQHLRSPIAIVANIHYAHLTDLTWSPDGRAILVSSVDGFCSFVVFAAGELGTPLSRDEQETLVEELQREATPDVAVATVGNAATGGASAATIDAVIESVLAAAGDMQGSGPIATSCTAPLSLVVNGDASPSKNSPVAASTARTPSTGVAPSSVSPTQPSPAAIANAALSPRSPQVRGQVQPHSMRKLTQYFRPVTKKAPCVASPQTVVNGDGERTADDDVEIMAEVGVAQSPVSARVERTLLPLQQRASSASPSSLSSMRGQPPSSATRLAREQRLSPISPAPPIGRNVAGATSAPLRALTTATSAPSSPAAIGAAMEAQQSALPVKTPKRVALKPVYVDGAHRRYLMTYLTTLPPAGVQAQAATTLSTAAVNEPRESLQVAPVPAATTAQTAVQPAHAAEATAEQPPQAKCRRVSLVTLTK